MRSQMLTLAFLLGLVAYPALSRSQDPALTPNVEKLGVINIQAAIASTAEGKKAFAEIQKKYEPRRSDLQRRDQEINAVQEQLQKQSTTLSEEEQLRLRRELEDKQKTFKRAQEDAQADFQADNQEIIRRIGQKMVRIIDDYAKQNGLVLVMDPSAVQMPVYYAADGIDITEAIVKRYDAANPESGGTAATSRPATPASPKPAKPGDKPKH